MAPAKILVVDDNTADVKLLRIALDQHGEKYEMQVLGSGEDALRFVAEHGKRGREHPCVILLDLNLPQYDGLVILKAIRQNPQLSDVRVVVLSGFASPQQRGHIESLGGIYMQKPLELADYFELGAKVIEICNGTAAVAA
jgi:CheY-like chemotaxis protein